MSGADANRFTLSEAGALAFKTAKDFEAPDDADGDGTYEVTVRVTDGANPVDAALEVTLTDVDEIAAVLPEVSVRAGTAYVKEGSDAVFTLTRTGDVSDALTVTLEVTASGAVLATPAPASAAFTAGLGEVEFRIPTIDDGEHTPDSTVTAGITAGRSYRPASGAASASVTVLDDDVAPPAVTGTVVWSADMTVVDYQTGAIGAASADLFSNQAGSAGLRATSLWYHAPSRKLRLAFSSGVDDADDLVLHAGELVLTFPEGSSGNSSFSWTGEDVAWTDDETVAVRLAEPVTDEEPADLSPRLAFGHRSDARSGVRPRCSALYGVGRCRHRERDGVGGSERRQRHACDRTGNGCGIRMPADHQVAVPFGETLIAVTVTAEDGETQRRYRVVAIRAPPAVTVSFESASYTATEGGDAAEVAVVLSSDPGRKVTIPLTAVAGGGAVAEDYAAPTGVTFASGGALTQTVAVTAAADDVAETGEEVVLGFGALSEGIEAGTTASATVTLADAAPANTAPTGLPGGHGTPKVGAVLTASVDDIADADGLDGVTYAYQWLANDGTQDTEIAGATGTTTRWRRPRWARRSRCG